MTCRSVILDTQNLRGAPIPLLTELVARGFRLHASAIALEELWAQAVREKKIGILVGRSAKIAPYIDAREPIKTAGVDLVRRLGGTVRGELQPSADDDGAALAVLWRQLCSGRTPIEVIEEAAKIIEKDAAVRGEDWLATNEAAGNVAEWNDSWGSERDGVRQVAHKFFEMFGPQLSIRDGMHERFHGYYSAAALHAVRARRRAANLIPKTEENDAEDLQLLMHLGEGVFIATYDLNLIEHVDASGSFQAPWVRTIGELLTIDLPAGVPWGRSARKARANHEPRERVSLNDLEKRISAGQQ